MADDTFVPREARIALAWAWWEAVDELRMTLDSSDDPSIRLQAAKIILEYSTNLNVGLGEPFLPLEPPPEDEPE